MMELHSTWLVSRPEAFPSDENLPAEASQGTQDGVNNILNMQLPELSAKAETGKQLLNCNVKCAIYMYLKENFRLTLRCILQINHGCLALNKIIALQH